MPIKKMTKECWIRFDDMSWPSLVGLDDIEWNLRYGIEVKPEEYPALLMAASVVSAYRSLLQSTKARREKMVSKIRKEI